VTANDHIKAIFAKTGVSNRGKPMATVFRDQSAPGHDTQTCPHAGAVNYFDLKNRRGGS
jgi:hypothetical protein